MMDGEEGYHYDVFVSWHREDPVLTWARKYFLPSLRNFLGTEMATKPRIFVDEQVIAVGERWPERLVEGVHRSKILLPIWEPGYFRSSWCKAELRMMEAREQQLGRRLILPVCVADGRHFPDWLGALQVRNFHDYFWDAPAFENSPEFLAMQKAIKALCLEISTAVESIPAWQVDFPRVREEELSPGPFHPLPVPRMAP